MNSIDNTEITRFTNWAKENGSKENILMPPLTGGSFFTPFEAEDNITAFGFSKLPELKASLETQWKNEPEMQGAILTCAVAAFKNRPQEEMPAPSPNSREKQEGEIEIPDFVYVF